MTKQDKIYLDERFEGMRALFDAHMENLHDRLDTITKQNEVRNGRIEKSEDEIGKLQIKEATHILNCPNVDKISTLEKTYEVLKFFIDHPKMTIAGIAVTVIFLLGGLNKWNAYTTHKDLNSIKIDIEKSIDSLKATKNARI